MVRDAQLLLSNGALDSAVDRAYYAMYRSASAALVLTKAKPPKSHAGLRNAFGRFIVSEGLVERDFARDLTAAFDARLDSNYGDTFEIDEDEAAKFVRRADAFVGRMERFIEGQSR